MEMKISEISKIFDIPPETLRYIERQGLLHPIRRDQSNYRKYNMIAFQELFEYMKYRRIGLSVKSIVRLYKGESLSYLADELDCRTQQIQKEIAASSLLCEYIRNYKATLEVLPYNIGTYWFRKCPEQQHIFVGIRGTNVDAYHDTYLATEWRKHVPFVSLACQIPEEQVLSDEWRIDCVFIIEKRYAKLLTLPQNENVINLPEQLCLCTYIKYTEQEERDCYISSLNYMKELGYQLNGSMTSILLARCSEQAKHYQYSELRLPVKKVEKRTL